MKNHDYDYHGGLWMKWGCTGAPGNKNESELNHPMSQTFNPLAGNNW